MTTSLCLVQYSIIGLEVSRLARNSSDWHHLLEICALTQTLILDEEGLCQLPLAEARGLLRA
jgi:DNA invertase Pin-like site-specific DNA recombinase